MLEATLAKLLADGRSAFPALDVEPTDFASFLGSIAADERAKKQLLMGDELVSASPGLDPELAYLRKTYAEELRDAFEKAFASLTTRERNVLRYYFIENRSIDQMGVAYGMHRATAARWVSQAREVLCAKTRALLAQRISFGEDGFRRILSLIDSEMSLHIAAVEA